MLKASKKIRAEIKTQYGTFMCIFEREPDMGGYVVEAPAVQGVVSWGKTLVQAKKKAVEAIEGMIEVRAIANAEREGSIRVTHRPTKIFS